MRGPIIVGVLFGRADFARLDALRRRYYPPERNRVQAHLTLFQHLPPSTEPELRDRLKAETRGAAAPEARLAGLIELDRGIALRVESPGLEDIRARLADAFAVLLIPQDRAGWRPHVTIQNKADDRAIRAAREELGRTFEPRPLAISGLSCWEYRGGPWSPIAGYRFRG